MLLEFDILMDQPIQAKKPDLVIMNKESFSHSRRYYAIKRG